PTVGTTCTFESTHTVSVPAGASCSFGIKFTAGTPPGLANSSATLNVTDNAAGSPQTAAITGLVGPLAVISGVNFGTIPVATTSPTMNATVSNAGGGTVNVTGIALSGTDAADFHLVPAAASGNPACPALPFSLAGGLSCDLGVSFAPSVPARVENATISITDNGIGSPQSAPLFGIGVQITSISPSVVATGGPAFTLTVNGGGFAPSAVVSVNGSARLTTFM